MRGVYVSCTRKNKNDLIEIWDFLVAQGYQPGWLKQSGGQCIVRPIEDDDDPKLARTVTHFNDDRITWSRNGKA